jgi:hypothetical protein
MGEAKSVWSHKGITLRPRRTDWPTLRFVSDDWLYALGCPPAIRKQRFDEWLSELPQKRILRSFQDNAAEKITAIGAQLGSGGKERRAKIVKS